MNNLKKHYINPQDLIEYLYEADAIDGRTAKLINQFPEEDVVKVVRCCECYFSHRTPGGARHCVRLRNLCNTQISYVWVSDEDFCSKGIREDGGQDDA